MNISTIDIKEIGTVTEVKQGIIKIDGMPSCMYGELLQFSENIKGIVTEFNEKEVCAVVLSDESRISVGDTVSSLTEMVNIPVGEGFIGRIVNALAEPIDGKGPIKVRDEGRSLPGRQAGLVPQRYPVFREAPGIMEREPIGEALMMGTKSVDLMIPIGKGQRELIIGDRQTGKSSLCLDAIINQRGKDVICIYCWIGGSRSNLKKHLHVLSENKAMAHTIVAAAPADTSVAEKYLIPYTAAALGEYFMHNGGDVLIVFDDLTKHAWVYREMSLLLERSPGREAYPGDIFYLHSHLLERAGRLSHAHGGGTMTFLPIVETLQGDITGYIQTNLISMTDGQIYISTPLFREGFKPAIDLGLSVSRIGSKVQCPAMRTVSEGLRLEYAQYREMLRLTRLRTRLSVEAIERVRRGETLQEMLLQSHSQPVSLQEEIVLFYAFKRKILEVLPKEVVKRFMNEFFSYLNKEQPQVVVLLEETRDLTVDVRKGLDAAFVSFLRMLEKEK